MRISIQKSTKQAIPNDKDTRKVLMNTNIMMNTMMRRGHKKPLDGSRQAVDSIGVGGISDSIMGLQTQPHHSWRHKDSSRQVEDPLEGCLHPGNANARRQVEGGRGVVQAVAAP